MDASGSVGDALTFAKWKGRNYVRRWAVPSNPKSEGQVSIRAGMSLYTLLYVNTASTVIATFGARAASNKISAFNQYVKEGLRLWRTNTFLGQEGDKSDGFTAAGSWTATATAGTRSVELDWSTSPPATIDAIIILRDTGGAPSSSFAQAFKVVNAVSTSFTDTDVTPGTAYYYRFLATKQDGTVYINAAAVNATPTA